MAVRSAPYYWVVCDRCGARHEGAEYRAWADREQAVLVAQESGWSVPAEEGRHLCWGCHYREIEGRAGA